jgi:catechol 2,3-dioxygenase
MTTTPTPTPTPAAARRPVPGVLDPRTALDHVHLVVHRLDAVLPFYTDIIGLRVHRREDRPDGRFVALGTGRHDLLRLTERPDAPRPERTAGLYHVSLNVPERIDFARWLKRIADSRTPLEGLVDHRFAEAIYLPDPEGNMVELNWDRPRDQWPAVDTVLRTGNGALDTDGLFGLLVGQPDTWDGAPADTLFSHIHLYVNDLAAAERFYVGVLGFERVMGIPGQATFVSAGGYHHHVAFNVWKGRGIPPLPEGAAGLRYFVVRLADDAERGRVLDRLSAAGLPTRDEPEVPGGALVRDPAGIGVVLASGTTSTARPTSDKHAVT